MDGAVSGKKMFEGHGHINVYSPGTGEESTWSQTYFQKHKI